MASIKGMMWRGMEGLADYVMSTSNPVRTLSQDEVDRPKDTAQEAKTLVLRGFLKEEETRRFVDAHVYTSYESGDKQ